MAQIDKNRFDGSLITRGRFFRRARLDVNQDLIRCAAEKYLDKKTGLVRREMSCSRSCLVCESQQRRLLFVKNGFPHSQCTLCGFVYVSRILKEEPLTAHYRDVSDAWAEVTGRSDYKEFQDLYYDFHLQNIESLQGAPHRDILDVGCNNGQFLLRARHLGWQVIGHEINTAAIQICRSKHIEIVDGEFDVPKFGPRRFGAITFFEVLEHLPDPLAALRTARELLTDRGVIGLMVPNIDGLATRILRERCNTFDGIEHLNFWNAQTINPDYA